MTQAIITTPDLNLMERVLVGGDLSKLTPGERLDYYGRVCTSLGLNPLTKPFDYIVLNGKMVLYAGRNCADQLRATRNITVTIVAREKMDDVYVVTARATTPDGRHDESVGAVPLGTLKGEALANALMKAETKAKRRVTLSICGLSWADESEVPSIPNAQPVAVDMETGEIAEPVREKPIAGTQRPSRDQYAMLKAHRERLGWGPEELVAKVGDPLKMTPDQAAEVINRLSEIPTPAPEAEV